MDQLSNPADLFSAKGLVVVVSGGATGIGYIIAAALHKTQAAKVYVLGRRLEKLQESAKSLDAEGKTVIPIQCDVADPSSVKKATDLIQSEVGYIDVLINNAGVSGPNQTSLYTAKSIKEIQSTLLKDWDGYASTYQINTAAVVGVSAAFLPLLDAGNKRKGWESGKLDPAGKPRQRTIPEGVDGQDLRTSQIITIASIAAFNRYVTAGIPYTSSKAGAVMISKTLASLLAPWGIRSNAVCPGIYPSEMTEGSPAEFPFDKVPVGRQGTPQEIGGAILHLVGKAGAYINGAVEVNDGGRLSVMPAAF